MTEALIADELERCFANDVGLDILVPANLANRILAALREKRAEPFRAGGPLRCNYAHPSRDEAGEILRELVACWDDRQNTPIDQLKRRAAAIKAARAWVEQGDKRG